MKNLSYILVAFLMSSGMLLAQNDAITKLFGQYTENDQFSTVYISPKMFQMISKTKGDEGDSEIAEISKDIKSLRILSTQTDPRDFYKTASATLNKDSFEELMSLKEKGNDIRFVTKSSGDIIKELVMIMGSDDNFTMLTFTGNIKLDKLSKLAGKLNIAGSDQLGKLNKK